MMFGRQTACGKDAMNIHRLQAVYRLSGCKLCTHCGEVKPLTAFYRKIRHDGLSLSHWSCPCKNCSVQQAIVYQRARRDRKFTMIKALAFLMLSTACANAAQLVLPSVVITMPAVVSLTPVCVASAQPKSAVGSVVFTCTVPPAGWTGTVQFSGGPPFSVTPLVGNTFNVILSTAVTATTTFPAPGSITTTP